MLLMCGDGLALSGALVLSLVLRYDQAPILQTLSRKIGPHATTIPLSILVYIGLYAAFRLYRYAWRFASLDVAKGVVLASTIGLGVMVGLQLVIDGFTFTPQTLGIFWMASVMSVGGVRIMLRLASLRRSRMGCGGSLLHHDLPPKRVVILGGGPSGARVLSALEEEAGVGYEVVGFLDDDPQRHGTYIRNARVIGPLKKLHDLLNTRSVDEVLIALPEASGADIKEYVLACRRLKVPVKVIPALQDVLNGKTPPRIEEISVEDLLRRPPVRINLAAVGEFVGGKRVMVTGAGGSIGSEICRQVIELDPEALILLGHGENSIHKIHRELCENHPAMEDRLRMVIASVADEPRMNQVFQVHRPQIVFHAAAHKHVPIMEANVLEAAQNNVIGTSIVAESCGRYGVENVVLISSDKAVYPTSVMGATKWLCERVVRAMVGLYRDTTYVTVRFGNVLGSRGSVVPLFHDQISKGGPVTVTHREMTRYFMSIPEAVQLVLQAGAVGKSGELYVLDMGDPVRILDLAQDMIRLCGLEPDKDIEIVFTGPRPGERLHERLAADDETIEPAFCKGLMVVRCPDDMSATEVMDVLRQTHQIINRGEEAEMRRLLAQVIPGFASSSVAVGPAESAVSVPRAQ